MSGFLGVQTDGVHELVVELRGWGSSVEPLIALVGDAEVLADYPTGVIGLLSEIGNDGQTLAARVQRATQQIEGYQLVLPQLSSRLGGGDRWLLALADGHKSKHAFDQPDYRDRGLFARADAGGADQKPVAVDRSEHHLGGLIVDLASLDRANELKEEIRRDTAAGRDPSSKRDELALIMTGVAGGSAAASPSQVASATSLLMNDLPASALAGGSDQALARIAAAMENGKSPEQSGLPESVFPRAYVRRHQILAEVAALNEQIGNDAKFVASLDQASGPAHHLGSVDDQIAAVGLDPNDRDALYDRLAITYPGLDTGQIYKLSDLIESDSAHLQAEVDSLRAQVADLRLNTLDGTVDMGPDGRLRPFDAVGATAATLPRIPSSFIGAAYGAEIVGFTFDELGFGAARIAGDEEAAVAFIESVPPERLATVLTLAHFMPNHPDEHSDPAYLQVERDLSTALGLASWILPPAYAAELIESPRSEAPPESGPAGPEQLFAHGNFAPAFLISGASSSISITKPVGAGVSGTELSRRDSPSVVLLDAVIRAEIAPEFVVALEQQGQLDALIWPKVHVVDYWNANGDMHVVSELLLQVATETDDESLRDRASNAVINSAGSRTDTLDINVANGVSATLGAQVPNYLDEPFQSPYFVAVENVFSVGAGVDVHAAALHALVAYFVERYANPYEAGDSFLGTDSLPGFMAKIDAIRFDVLLDGAKARDQSARNTKAWIGTLTSFVGVTTGGFGFVAKGAAGKALTATGSGSSVIGWVAPGFIGNDDNVENFLEEELHRRDDDHAKLQASILLAIARGDILVHPGGSFRERTQHGLIFVDIIIDGAVTHSWQVDRHDPSWGNAAVRELEEAGFMDAEGHLPSAVVLGKEAHNYDGDYAKALKLTGQQSVDQP